MKPIIIANWKCNPIDQEKAIKLFNSIKNKIKKNTKAEIIICPPFIFLADLNLKKSKIKFGAQNCFYEEKGAFTGEISPLMIKDSGCEYVILGHSERRKYLNETDEIINKKLKLAIKSGLKVILCVGESLEDRKNKKTEQFLNGQVKKGLKGINQQDLKNLILAYEPLWAIGSGKPCLADEARNVAIFLRKVIAQNYSSLLAKKLPVLYGGSVNSKNSGQYLLKKDISGLLIGGASLDAEEFAKIIKQSA